MAGLKPAGADLCYNGGLLAGTVYISLHTGDASAANELSGNAYARVAVALADWTFDSNAGTAAKTAAVTFPTPTGTWGDATDVGVWDASSGGNLLASFPFDDDVRPAETDDEVSFPAGTLILELTVDAAA